MIGSSLRTTVLLLAGVCLVIPNGAEPQATRATVGAVQGTVFLGGANEPVYVSGANVVLYSDTGISSTVTDREGKFAFSKVDAPGIYFVEATYYGVHAGRNVRVDAGAVVQLALQLEVPDPNTSAKP